MPDAQKSYPLVGFYYRVQFANSRSAPDAAFKEVSGLSVSMQSEEVAEGGENRFKHKLPTGARFENLVLKRGLCTAASPVYQWLATGIGGGLAKPLKLNSFMIVLMNDQEKPLRTWRLNNAWPVKWEISSLQSMESEVVIESLEVAYQYFELK